jgi:polyhydroxyalkanoate synthesis regulator phasin
MKKLLSVCAIGIAVTFSGCLTPQQIEATEQWMVEYIESRGQEQALEYIDKLVAEGRLGSKNAEELKVLIPELVEKIKARKDKEDEQSN